MIQIVPNSCKKMTESKEHNRSMWAIDPKRDKGKYTKKDEKLYRLLAEHLPLVNVNHHVEVVPDFPFANRPLSDVKFTIHAIERIDDATSLCLALASLLPGASITILGGAIASTGTRIVVQVNETRRKLENWRLASFIMFMLILTLFLCAMIEEQYRRNCVS